MSVLALVATGAAPLASAHADTLTELRSTLQGLNAHTVINGVLDVQSDVTRGKADAAKQHAAHLQLQIQAGAGLGIQLSPALLQHVTAEKAAHAADPNHPAPTADLLDQTGPWQIENIVSVAPMLLRLLAGAESPHVKPAQLYGQPVQELSVKLPPPVSKTDSSNLKDYASTATVWLDSKGIPLAYGYSRQGKFCKFFLCVTVSQSESGSLQVIDRRLVAMTMIQENKQSGLGQDSDTHAIYTLQVSPLPANTTRTAAPAAVSKPD
ncbi:MAG: hypothetical protein ACRESA_09135 [Gammaproteobacteria bacterium]